MTQHIVAALTEIKTELIALELWSSLPPSPEALASTAPFCCDTLPFEQWLQFVLLPRMQALLDGGHPLPTKVSILPMAEVAFADYSQDMRLLMYWLGRFDACFQTD
ncbi:MAG: YqcC family protein [Alkalimonas sp.]|uniref:YqcC family protein n=2 Tax=Alkalimonas delamerensis TaxID=265981 RepID=A0ABT9GM37_9GAMM|nr:YqcC family protein [Alkalimonas delamerensis]MCC5852155.1 YqcC family protein [Alkalimonas sp.]MDP4528016.1 YqcC family protein [Alkalimonas delamerensis]